MTTFYTNKLDYFFVEDTVRYNSCFCDIEKKASCQLELLPYGWKWIDDTDFSPILDRSI